MSAKKTVKIKNALDKDANSLSNVVEKAELWLLPIAVDARADSNVEAAIYFASRHKKEVIDADNLKESWCESICEDIERGEHFAKLGKEVKKRVKLKTISLAEASEVLSGNHTNSLSRFFDCHDCRDYNEEDFIDATFFRAVDWLSIVGFKPWLDSLSHYTASRLTGVAEHINGIWYLFFWCRSNQAMDSTGIIPLQAALWTLMRGSVEESKPWIKPPSLTQNKCFGDITVAGLLPFIWHRINPSGLDYKIITEALGFLFQTQMRSGGWPFSTTESKPGIWPTCVAIHSLAMTKPRGWEQMCKKASEWLITQQTKDGYWHVSEVPAVMITVLVLDSINLANNSDNVTFRMSNRINHLQEEKVSQKKGKKIEKRKGKERKLEGKKKHYIEPKERENIIKEIIEGYPRGSNVSIARKAMIEIEKKHGAKSNGKPWYTEKTLAKEVSKLKTKKNRRENAR